MPLIYQPFSKSKLFELLSVDKKQFALDINNKVVRPDMTVLAIREYVKNYQAQQKEKERIAKGEEPKAKEDKPAEIEEEIEMAYDPKKAYEFAYFEKKTKSQLLNIVWDLQKEYQKLKKEKTKKWFMI